jgi:hypothetical protein
MKSPHPINAEGNDAAAIMDVNYKAWVEYGKLSENYKGKAISDASCPYGGWSIYSMTCPDGSLTTN